jgi:N-acetylmuramoyl-L-alanine amidase
MRIGRVNQPASQLLSVAVEPSNQSQTVSSTNPNRWTVTPRRPQRTWNPSLSNNSQRNARMVVVIDPGHGGRDPGALGINGLREKDIVMSISQQVAANLNQFGIQAVLTRQNDREIDLEPRVQLAERVNGTVFVSIHANSVDLSRPEVNGVETYYYSTGRGLARSIHNHLLQVPGTRDRGVRQARFYVLRNTSMPAVLVEVGFITGRQDAARLANPAYRSQLSAAIARGIFQYLQANP